MVSSSRVASKAVLVSLVLFFVAGAGSRAWDIVSCGSKASFIPQTNCRTERCCQCNYQWDIDACGGDEWCKKGALATLQACNRAAGVSSDTADLHVVQFDGIAETYHLPFHSLRPVRGAVWVLSGSGSGAGDPYGVRGAEILVNGRPVPGTHRLREAGGEISFPIDIEEGANEITVTVTGPAGSTLTIVVYAP